MYNSVFDRPRVEERGMYFKVAGDERWMFDSPRAVEIMAGVPNYWEDTCPSCGNKEGITGCRCPRNDRQCPVCKVKWYWSLDKNKACLSLNIY